MADSILEKIAKNIVASLEQVRPANGYENTFTVTRRKRQGNAPQSGQTLAVVAQGTPILIPSDSHPDITWDQPFGIDIYVDPDETRNADVESDINSALADAHIALVGDETGRTRGGFARDTLILAPVPFIEGAAHGVQFRIMVRYSTIFNNPRQM